MVQVGLRSRSELKDDRETTARDFSSRRAKLCTQPRARTASPLQRNLTLFKGGGHGHQLRELWILWYAIRFAFPGHYVLWLFSRQSIIRLENVSVIMHTPDPLNDIVTKRKRGKWDCLSSCECNIKSVYSSEDRKSVTWRNCEMDVVNYRCSQLFVFNVI